MAIVKTLVRTVVITGLAGGAVVLIAEAAAPGRLSALAGQARQRIVNRIDSAIDDPVALRAQLRDLEAKYPERIAEIRGDLAELTQQMSDLERDRAIAEKVVEMASADLSEMKSLISHAETARSESPFAVISVRHGGSSYSLDQAYAKATQVNNTLNAYRTRTADAVRDLAFLQQQADRLGELLSQMETERAQFQAQIWQLDGQIEMIARNDKLIELVEKRQQAIDRYDKFEAVSLDQVTARMSKIRAEQESRLQALANASKGEDYESKAKAMLDAEKTAREVFEKVQEQSPVPAETIEIGPDGQQASGNDKNVASVSPARIVIE